MNGQQHIEELQAPTFRLPENQDRFELWTVRLPRQVDLQSLHGQSVTMSKKSPQPLGTDYTMAWGDAGENESFRLLLPQDDEDDEMNDDEARFLYPHTKGFRKHVNVALVGTHPTELAPAEAPPPVDPMRHAYASVPQKKGLKRRWAPLGGGGPPVTTTTRMRPPKEEEKTDGAAQRTNGVKRVAKELSEDDSVVVKEENGTHEKKKKKDRS